MPPQNAGLNRLAASKLHENSKAFVVRRLLLLKERAADRSMIYVGFLRLDEPDLRACSRLGVNGKWFSFAKWTK